MKRCSIRIKKLLAAACSCSCFCRSCLGPVALAQSTTVLVAVDPSFPPFARLNAQGEPEGFDVDLMNALAAEAGFAVSFEAVQFRYLLSGLVTHL